MSQLRGEDEMEMHEGLRAARKLIMGCERGIKQGAATINEERALTQALKESLGRLLTEGRELGIPEEELDDEQRRSTEQAMAVYIAEWKRQRLRRGCLDNAFQMRTQDLCTQEKQLRTAIRGAHCDLRDKQL